MPYFGAQAQDWETLPGRTSRLRLNPLALLLSRRGFDVERAGDAAAALGTFERFRPDVVLADLQLGADSGVELALSLRARGGNLRIIAASGRAREELGSEAGLFDAFVRKPIELDALLSLLGPRP